MGKLYQTSLPDLLVGVIDDTRQLVVAEVSSLKADVGDRLSSLSDAIRSWLVAVCVAIVTASLLGVAIAATLAEVVGLPWFVSLWIVTAIAIGAVAALVYHARSSGRRVVSATSEPPTSEPPPPALPAGPLQGSL